MFKYIKAVLIIVLLLLGASLVNGKDITKAADSSAASISDATALVVVQTATQDESDTLEAFMQTDGYTKFVVDNVWILLSAMLVFLMHLGFATVESGFMPAKNTVNVIYKNIFILTTGILTYSIVGFRLMYPGEFNLWDGVLGFHDFAGSTLVHAVGGAAALVGAWMLGPRLGKYTDGKPNEIPGHSLPLATIGVLLLWFGWFGFNGGSVLSAQPDLIGLVLVNTALAAAAGSLAAMSTATFLLHKMDLGMALNGILGGLVGITASADVVNPGNAIIIGALSGGLVVASIILLEKWGIDDPVSAISVHGVCGIWGTLAVGLFAPGFALSTQAIGTFSVVGFTLVFSAVTFTVIKLTMGVRADETAERTGMDAFYHGHTAYPDFMGKN